MNRDDISWQGYWASCPTPFTEDESLDFDLFGRILSQYASWDLHGVLVNGTVGEWYSQTSMERKLLAEWAVAELKGTMTIVVGCTAYTAKEVIDFGEHAMRVGADGVLVSPPPYAKLFPEEIIQFYEDISASLDAPLIVYNWPHGTNVDIGPDLAERLSDVGTVVAIKDSTPSSEQFYETNRRVVGKVRVFGPFMSTDGLSTLCKDGGDGFIGGGSVFGARDAAFWEAFWRGDLMVCNEHARRTDALFSKLWLPGGWAGRHGAYQSELKIVMSLLGQESGCVRRPRLPITDPKAIEEIRQVLIEAELLDQARSGDTRLEDC